MPTATKNAAERTRLAIFSLSLTPIIYILFISGYKYKEEVVSCFPFSFTSILSFKSFLSKKRLDCCPTKKRCVLDTPGD